MRKPSQWGHLPGWAGGRSTAAAAAAARSQLSCKLMWHGIMSFRKESDKRRHKYVME